MNRLTKKDPRVRQPAAVAVAMLHDLTQDHEEREAREDRHDPEKEVIQGGIGRHVKAQPGQAVEDQLMNVIRSSDIVRMGITGCTRLW